MLKSDFYYELPPELIAQTPIEPRDASRMLRYSPKDGKIEHRIFREIEDLLVPGDVLVLNNTRVIPARLFAKDEAGRDFEILLLKRLDYTKWEALIKPARKAKLGAVLKISDELSLAVAGFASDNGVRIVAFSFEGVFEDILDRVGNMPLPPYITEKLQDKERYQTVYSKIEGSAAAPTAGLHFTKELLDRLKRKGVIVAEILLHVGLGTFRPVKETEVEKHEMHVEYYEISESAAAEINWAAAENRRVIAVGTTSVRTLESAADDTGRVRAEKGYTGIYIYPPYRFKVVKGLITNFHLPESTLIMLVSAMIGREKTLELYRTAVEARYRFFSFGDAMLIL